MTVLQTSQSTRVSFPLESQVAHTVRRTLKSSPYHEIQNINATLRGNELTLCGFVSSYFLKQKTLALVGKIDGVDSIKNNLQVVYSS